MQLRLTLVAEDASTEPVLLTAAPGDTVGDVVALLSRDGHLPADARLAIGESALTATDLVGMPPLLDGAVVRVVNGSGRPLRSMSSARWVASASPIRLEVVGGPDAGAVLHLSPGRHRVGRGADCELSVADPHLSRVHAEVEVTSSGLVLTEVSPTNGMVRIAADGELTAFATGALVVGDQVRMGTTTLVVRAGAPRPSSVRPVGDGTLAVTRMAGRSSGWVPVTLTRPAPAADVVRAAFPWVQVLLPLPVCGILAWLWGPQMLAFALLGPLLAGGTAVGDRFGARRRARDEAARQAAALAAHDAARRDAVAAERAHLCSSHPDPATVLTAATTPTSRLWDRSGGAVVRLGTSSVRGASEVLSSTGERECLSIAEAPVTVDLSAVGSLGIGGRSELVPRSGAWVVTQLAALVPPASLSIDVVGEAPDWDWVRLLPHAHDPTVDVVATLRARLDDAGPSAGARPSAVLLVPDPGLVSDVPGLADLVVDGRRTGVHVVVLDPHGHGLPAGLGATLHVEPDPSGTLLSAPGAPSGEDGLVVDGISLNRAEAAARSLAPLREARTGPGGALPTRLALADVLADPVGSSRVDLQACKLEYSIVSPK